MKIKCPKCHHKFEVDTLADTLYELWNNEEDEVWNDFQKEKTNKRREVF